MVRFSKSITISFLACLSSSAFAGQLDSFQQSKQRWQKLKQSSPLAYEYSTEFESWTGMGATTTFHVVDDTILSRFYQSWIWYYDYENNGKYTRETKERWFEGPTQIGQHQYGEAPKTMDQVYEQCEMQVLSLDPNQNVIEFTIDRNGLIQKCQARSIYCADDCWEGINIVKLKIFKNPSN